MESFGTYPTIVSITPALDDGSENGNWQKKMEVLE
jgi:hypothetical protein